VAESWIAVANTVNLNYIKLLW